MPVQQDGFRWHIDLAKRLGKALQIHDRDAHDDVLRILEEEGAPEHTVLHCFSGDLTMARECVERGYYLSFAGTVTFKNARDLRDALTAIPLDRILVETDAPYLAPAPHRGATNASFLVPVTIRAMAARAQHRRARACAERCRTTASGSTVRGTRSESGKPPSAPQIGPSSETGPSVTEI